MKTMQLSLLIVTILIHFYLVDAAKSKCKPNETYQECGTACPVTCANKDNPPMSCTKQCVKSCVCMEGTYKNSDGRCVLPQLCGVNSRTRPGGVMSRSRPGGVMSRSRHLRPPGGAKKCGPNQVYKSCGSACPLTCANRDSPEPQICTANCVVGCFCKKGFLKRRDGRCVPANACYAPNKRPVLISRKTKRGGFRQALDE